MIASENKIKHSQINIRSPSLISPGSLGLPLKFPWRSLISFFLQYSIYPTRDSVGALTITGVAGGKIAGPTNRDTTKGAVTPTTTAAATAATAPHGKTSTPFCTICCNTCPPEDSHCTIESSLKMIRYITIKMVSIILWGFARLWLWLFAEPLISGINDRKILIQKNG